MWPLSSSVRQKNALFMKRWLRHVILLLGLFVTGCERGYKMVDGTWFWVKWDEGGGRRNKLEDVDLESFQIIDRELAKDKDSVWDSGLHHFRVDGSRVVILGRSWIKDDKHVYCRNGNIGLIDGLEASKF
ncbi:MAG: hypothetical protein ACK52N_03295, partial [Lysobacteraceae bacterium]